jgi:hypothetical protein
MHTAKTLQTSWVSVRKLRRQINLYTVYMHRLISWNGEAAETLLYKLVNLGIKLVNLQACKFRNQGRLLDQCIKHMYSNSKAEIKLLDMLVGTEKGHPMSPDLFKFFSLIFQKSSTMPQEFLFPNSATLTYPIYSGQMISSC